MNNYPANISPSDLYTMKDSIERSSAESASTNIGIFINAFVSILIATSILLVIINMGLHLRFFTYLFLFLILLYGYVVTKEYNRYISYIKGRADKLDPYYLQSFNKWQHWGTCVRIYLLFIVILVIYHDYIMTAK